MMLEQYFVVSTPTYLKPRRQNMHIPLHYTPISTIFCIDSAD